MNKKQFGYQGENIAADYLRSQGYKIVQRNFSCRMGEIDIIARKGKDLYFVEVKTRKDNRFGTPLESITLKKQAQLIKVAKYFLMKHKKEISCHFSAIGIILDEAPNIEFLPDAFTT